MTTLYGRGRRTFGDRRRSAPRDEHRNSPRFVHKQPKQDPSVDRVLVGMLAELCKNSFKLAELGKRFPGRVKREKIPGNNGRATTVTVQAQIEAQKVELAKYEGLLA
ncbi:hypothetical protein CZP2022_237 [Vibrio phage C-ZP2022]|nr:hypothetical protein CZP2022_237 [Vibrio phage C-ZP2022]